MKRSLLIGSFLCVAIGVAAIICAIIQTPFKPTVFVLLILYFVGVPVQYTKCLPLEDVKRLANGDLYAEFGRAFWLRILLGLIMSSILAVWVYKSDHMSLGYSILFGLGCAAILTAFVSPDIKREREVEEFG